MKKIVLLFTFAILTFAQVAYSQLSDVVFYSNEGLKFWVVINGLKYNDNPQTNVVAKDLIPGWYKSKILFDEKGLEPVEQGFQIGNSPVEMRFEVLKKVNKDNTTKYVVRWRGETPLPPPAPQATNPPPPPPNNTSTNNTSTTTTTTTTTTAQPYNPSGVNVNVDLNQYGGGGVSVNVNPNGTTDVNVNAGGTVVRQSTTTTSSSTVVTPRGGATSTSSTTVVEPGSGTSYVPGYNGPVGCPMPMNPNDFANAQNTIRNASFEDTKLTIAKQVAGSNCFTSQQVSSILGLFGFEESKLEFAKFAYTHTYDINNYFNVNNAFTFDASVQELSAYINSVRR